MGGVAGGDPPGILALLDLIDRHRGAFEYDWRTRFGVALRDVGADMSWGEGWRLALHLAGDPSTAVGAAVGRLQYPVTREFLVTADVFDLLHKVNAKHTPKPYPRPWKRMESARVGGTKPPAMSQVSVRAVLAAARSGGDVKEAAAHGE